MGIGRRVLRGFRLLLDKSLRQKRLELRRLKRLPRRFPTATSLLGENRFEIVDAHSFLYLYHELIEKQIYSFQTKQSCPLIIDGGANVGVAILAFKRQFPRCRVIAFEPDPTVYAVLERNCEGNALEDVVLIQKALWNCEASLCFEPDGVDAGRIADQNSNAVGFKVGACRLRDYITEPVALLKLDIEGAESVVLSDCKDRLALVENIFVEYHSFEKQPQSLGLLINVLRDAGFRLYLESVMQSSQPFVARRTHAGMDCLLHIFAFRDPA